MSQNINTVVITGNLTRDPVLNHTGGGTAVANLRIASNTRRKNDQGEWVDKANYFDVTVWGARGESCKEHLAKGRPVAIEGRLEWREWVNKDGDKRQSVEIVANAVQFLGKGKQGESGQETSEEATADRFPSEEEPVGVGAGGEQDDIPF